jgi:hypothetical protein
MRVLIVLSCLALAACAGNPHTRDVSASAAPAAASAQARTESERVMQARADCWVKVEHQKGLRNIDGRIAFVDKCVADTLRDQARP